ncbi:MAG TPA: hypothetical protein VKB47_03820 [Terracidiphilus sp.]|nr:hypothetical protein [Terracidiphilus sp.]
MIQVANPPPTGAVARAPAPSSHFLSTFEGELSLVIVGLTVVVLATLAILLWKKDASAEDSIRAFALVLIILGTIVLISAGYSNDQIAPAVGLFGTLAGYLLGRKGSQS